MQFEGLVFSFVLGGGGKWVWRIFGSFSLESKACTHLIMVKATTSLLLQ
jgi:hypothetical protein